MNHFDIFQLWTTPSTQILLLVRPGSEACVEELQQSKSRPGTAFEWASCCYDGAIIKLGYYQMSGY